MSAQHLIERLVEMGAPRKFDIELVCEETSLPYDRINLASILEGKSPTTLQMRPSDWYEQNKISVRLGEPVVSLDPKIQSIQTNKGSVITFDQLVLATGGTPFVPPIPGADLKGVLTYRTVEDVKHIAAQTRPGFRVLIIGGGLLGLETGRMLVRQGCSVEIVEAAPRLLPRQLDTEGAALLESQIRSLGITLDLRKQVTEIRRKQDTLTAHLSSGPFRQADLIIIAAGIRPRDQLARSSGLSCSEKGGIQVDDRLRTSSSNIWAIGECVQHRDRTYGFVSPCYEMAETVALNLMGKRRRFLGASPAARLKVDEVDIVTVGESLSEGRNIRVLAWVGEAQYRRIVLRNNRIVGAIAIGSGSEFPILQEAVARRTRVWETHRQRFLHEGRLWPKGTSKSVKDWPDQAVVCTCTGVTCGRLRTEKRLGLTTSEQLSQKTGAGTVCGTCRPLLSELAEETQASAEKPKSLTHLGLVGGLSLAALSLGAFVGPIPMSTSTQVTSTIDVIWREAIYKQISGFSLLGLCLLSLGLSIRKRTRSNALGSFGFWRFLHTVLGTSALAAVGVHTGFRLGANLNFVLMSCFLALVAVGSIASMVVAVERYLPALYAGRLRRIWTTAHILLFWPMPVLVLFHIICAYYY